MRVRARRRVLRASRGSCRRVDRLASKRYLIAAAPIRAEICRQPKHAAGLAGCSSKARARAAHPAGVDDLDLAVASEGLGVSRQAGAVPAVVAGELALQVGGHGALGEGAQPLGAVCKGGGGGGRVGRGEGGARARLPGGWPARCSRLWAPLAVREGAAGPGGGPLAKVRLADKLAYLWPNPAGRPPARPTRCGMGTHRGRRTPRTRGSPAWCPASEQGGWRWSAAEAAGPPRALRGAGECGQVAQARGRGRQRAAADSRGRRAWPRQRWCG